MASAVVEINQLKSDSSLASKSTSLHDQIDSVSVDNLFDGKSNEAGIKCNHFSIRGYVSEVRKKDPKLCDPFSLNDSRDCPTELTYELPPMVVPKFRWWRCVGCVPEAVSYNEADIVAQKSADVADASTVLIGETSKVNDARVRNAEASTSTDSNDNRKGYRSNLFSDPKGKGKARVEDELTPLSGCENGFLKDSLSQGILQKTAAELEVDGAADDEAKRRPENVENRIPEAYHNCIPCSTERVPSVVFVDLESENVNESSQEKTGASSEDQRGTSPIKGVGTEVAGIVRGPSCDGKGRLVHLPDLNECSGEPPYEDHHEPMVTGSTSLFEDDDDYLGAERRKTPKVRLLSDLLGLKANQNDAKAKKKNSDSQWQSPVNENGKRNKVGSQDDDSRSVEIRGSNNGTKKLRTPRFDISHSDSEDESTEIISEALAKRRSRSSLDKNPLLEKRNKKIKADNGGSYSVVRQKIIPKSSHNEGKSVDKRFSVDGFSWKPCHSLLPDGVMGLPQKSDVSGHLNEKNSLFAKKKSNKMLQAGKELNSLVTCKSRMPSDCAATRRDDEALQNATENVQQEPCQDGSAGKGLSHFPSSHSNKRNDQMCNPPWKDGLYLPLSREEPMLFDGGSVRKLRAHENAEETSTVFKTVVDVPLMGSQFDGNKETRLGPKTKSKEKQAWIPEVEEVTKLGMHQKKLTNEVRGRMHDIDINSIPTDDKVTEQGSGDDIPMDIVELMAKNQYERHLSDGKDTQCPVTQAMCGEYIKSNGISGVYGEHAPRLGQPHFLSMQMPPPADDRNCMVGRFDDVGPSKQKVLGPFPDYGAPLGFRTLPRDNQVSPRFLSPSQGQEHIPPYSTRGLVPHNWNGNVAAPQFPPPSFLRAMESYSRLRACSPRQNSEARVWPSLMANRMPVGITNPQMLAQSSSVLNKAKIPYNQGPGPCFLNFNAGSNLEKQNLNFSNSAYSGVRPENPATGKQPMGSADLYSNEAIPAMHLLSLMQNAAKMRAGPPGSSDQQYKQHSSNQQLGLQKVTSSSRQALLENNGRTSIQENSSHHPCYPALPTARPFASSFQNEGAIGRNTGFISPIPLTSRGQRNMGISHFPRSQKLAACHGSRKRQLGSAVDKGKSIAASSSHRPSVQAMHDLSNNISGVGSRRDERTACPVPEKIICVLNQNPREFTDEREANRYMIGPYDLRPGLGSRLVTKGCGKSARPRGAARRQDMRMNKPISSGKVDDQQRKT